MKPVLLLLAALFLLSGTSSVLRAADTGPVCTPDGVCYLPGAARETAASAVPEQFTVLRRQIGLTDADGVLKFLRGTAEVPDTGAFWGMLLLALAGGFLLNLTPCVLPMIPVNLAIIGAAGGAAGFRRGLLYGLGMAAAYGTLGILAAFAGVGFGGLNAAPWFNFAVGAVLLVMAAAMTGAVNFDLSSFLPRVSGRLRTLPGVAPLLLGALAALLAGACVAPVAVSILLYTARAVTEGRYYAAVIPFALGIGMALPWPLAGAGLAVLPKPGRFMAAVKYLFAGVIFLAAGYYILAGIRLASAPATAADGFAALEAARVRALRENRPILVKFTASWCGNCAAMERGAWRDPRVRTAVEERVIPVTFPAEDPAEPRIAALLKAWEIPGFPALVLLKPVLAAPR
ncbi:MAG: thioredoxin family protein [Lentisphaeria bacterium]|nr:thioredoxin family protein [Lentisphaeria bacterium]